MRNISNEFRSRLYNDDYRNYVEDIYITLSDGTELRLTNENLWGYGLYIDDAVSADNTLEIGSAIVGAAQVVIENISETYNLYNFDKAKVVPYVGVDLGDGTNDMVKLGEYYVNAPKHNTSCITLTCYDAMMKFDKPISLSNMEYPATLNQIIADACRVCGVPLATQTIPHGTYQVAQKPDGGTTTFRELLAWAGQISGRNARINVNGQLEFIWYDAQKLNAILNHQQVSGIHEINTTFGSPEVSLNDVTITQINVSEEVEDEQGHKSIARYTYGNTGYTISIEGNKLVQNGHGSEIAQWLLSDLSGFRFRKASFSCLSDPSIEAGDILKLTDRKGNIYACIVSATKFQVGNSQTVRSSAADPERTSVPKNSQQVKNYVGLMVSLGDERAARAESEAQIIERIDANVAEIGYLRTDVAQIGVLSADLASFREVTTENFSAVNASINTIRTDDLTAINADIDNLQADYANINTILSGNVGTGQLQTITLTAENSTVDTSFVNTILANNAIIQSLIAGNIDTDLIRIASGDNSMVITGSTQQFKDAEGNVRLQLGKDRQGNYSFSLFNENGDPVWYEDGITKDAVPDGLIVDEMVADSTATYNGISASKLNIKSVKGAIEEGGFKSSLIYFDESGQTLNQVYTEMTSNITSASNVAQQAKTSADATFNQLNQIKDTIAGIDTLEGMVLMLTNDAHVVHTYNDGTGGDYRDAQTGVIVMLGETDVTSQALLNYTESPSVTGTWDNINKIYQVTNLTDTDGYVDFEATYGSQVRYLTSRSGLYYTTRSGKRLKIRSGAAHLSKRFSISKSPDGRVGVSYSILANVLAITRDATNVLIPNNITFTAIANNGTITESYQGYLKIEETTDNRTYSTTYTSASPESVKTYTPTSTSVKQIRCTLMDDANHTLDMQSVAVIADADGMQVDIAQAKQSIQTLNTKMGTVETGIDGLRVDLEQTQTEIHGVSDGILVFQTPYQWTANGATANFRAVVYRHGVDATSDFSDSQFEWFIKTEDGESKIGTGKTCAVSKSSVGYGATVIGRFTTAA